MVKFRPGASAVTMPTRLCWPAPSGHSRSSHSGAVRGVRKAACEESRSGQVGVRGGRTGSGGPGTRAGGGKTAAAEELRRWQQNIERDVRRRIQTVGDACGCRWQGAGVGHRESTWVVRKKRTRVQGTQASSADGECRRSRSATPPLESHPP